MLGLLSAAAHLFLHYGTQAVLPAEFLQANPHSSVYFVAMWVAVGAGLVIFGLTQIRKLSSDLMLDIGLIFEVVGSLCIGLIEASHFSAQSPINLGPTGIA